MDNMHNPEPGQPPEQEAEEAFVSLEDLMNEPVDEATDEGDAVATEQDADEGVEEPAAVDELDDLDQLLAESMTSRRQIVDAKAAKERLKRGGLSARERLEDQARVAAWEAAHEWLAVANVAHFGQQVCQCGAASSIFFGVMERQKHRHLREAFRWVQVTEAKAALPNEVAYRTSYSIMCSECCTGKGWDWSKAVVWER